jgi:hypothetical protein
MANQHVPKGDLADNKYMYQSAKVECSIPLGGSRVAKLGGACHLWNPTNPTQNDFGPTLVAPPGFLGAHRSV